MFIVQIQKVLGKETPIGKLSPDIPVYIINEGCEPPFFTQCFEWDSSKANVRKLKSSLKYRFIYFSFLQITLNAFTLHVI